MEKSQITWAKNKKKSGTCVQVINGSSHANICCHVNARHPNQYLLLFFCIYIFSGRQRFTSFRKFLVLDLAVGNGLR